jgi:hypothetical protein
MNERDETQSRQHIGNLDAKVEKGPNTHLQHDAAMPSSLRAHYEYDSSRIGGS